MNHTSTALPGWNFPHYHSVVPEAPEPAIVETHAIGKGYSMRVEAGEVPWQTGDRISFVRVAFDIEVTPETTAFMERLTGQVVSPDSRTFSGTLDYLIEGEGGALVCSRSVTTTDAAGSILHNTPHATADTERVDAWRVRNFLRVPVPW